MTHVARQQRRDKSRCEGEDHSRGKITWIQTEVGILGGEHKRRRNMRKRGKETSVCCILAEYLLSLETTAHPGGSELFLLDHEIEHQCPENVSVAAHAYFLCWFHAAGAWSTLESTGNLFSSFSLKYQHFNSTYCVPHILLNSFQSSQQSKRQIRRLTSLSLSANQGSPHLYPSPPH